MLCKKVDKLHEKKSKGIVTRPALSKSNKKKKKISRPRGTGAPLQKDQTQDAVETKNKEAALASFDNSGSDVESPLHRDEPGV